MRNVDKSTFKSQNLSNQFEVQIKDRFYTSSNDDLLESLDVESDCPMAEAKFS